MNPQLHHKIDIGNIQILNLIYRSANKFLDRRYQAYKYG